MAFGINTDGDMPAGMIKGIRGKVIIMRLIESMMELRYEVAGNNSYTMSSIAGIKAAERWMQL